MVKEDKDNKESKAVALKYDIDDDPSPRLVAKGSGYIADQIIKIAAESKIPIREDAALVDILEVLEVDDFIPTEAYAAVAEILSYIYKQNAKKNH